MEISSIQELEKLAKSCINDPWGYHEPFLANSESQPPYYRFLHNIVSVYMPQVVIECGVYMATASVHMAIANKETKVIGIDVNPHNKAYSALLMYENFHIIFGNTTDEKVVKELLPYKNMVGLLFLDSEHDGITATKEYDLYKDLFADVCVVACDDILDKRMHDFWENLPGEKMEMNFLHPAQYAGYPDPGFGVSIVRK